MIFRPSALVTLQLRLYAGDEDAALEPEPDALPARSSVAGDEDAALEDVDRAERALAARRGALPPAEYEELRRDLRQQRASILRAQTAAEGDAPEALSGPASDPRVVLTGILPSSVEIVRNGLTTADTATIELAHSDAPFDPRAIRSAAVEIVVGTVDAVAYAAGMSGATRDDGSALSVVGRIGEGEAPPGVTRFVGVVDTWAVSLADDDRITLTCRDLTSLLLDEPLPRGAGVDLTQPLDRGVRDFLEAFPALRGFTVAFGVDDEPAIVPADALPSSRRTGAGGRRARRQPRAAEMKVWDYLSDLAVSLGLVATLEDYTIRFIRPRTFYASRARARRFVYGRNLASLDFERKLGGVKTPTVEVRSFDPVLGRTRWARYPTRDGAASSGVFPTSPPRPSRANNVQPSGAGQEDKIQTFPISGFSDPTSLEAAAESIWQQLARQELEGTFETEDVSSYESEEPGDLLELRAGDAVELLVASQDAQDVREQLVSAGILAGLSVAARARYLERLGYRQSVARALAQIQETAAQFTTFRVDTATIRFGQDEGIAITVEFRNFLLVEEPRPSDASASASATGRRRRGNGRAPSFEELEEEVAELLARTDALIQARASGEIGDDVFNDESDDLTRQGRSTRRAIRERFFR